LLLIDFEQRSVSLQPIKMSIYSDVFKKRVLQAHSKGLSITECSEKYEIHRSTVSRWIEDVVFESKLWE